MKMNLTGAIEILKLHKHTTDKFKHSVGDQYVSDAIDTVVSFYESPQNESEEIPEILKGTEYDYMMQIKDLIKNQHTMTPDWVIAHAMSIVCYAYSAGVDFVVDTLKLEKKGEDWEAKQRGEATKQDLMTILIQTGFNIERMFQDKAIKKEAYIVLKHRNDLAIAELKGREADSSHDNSG